MNFSIASQDQRGVEIDKFIEENKIISKNNVDSILFPQDSFLSRSSIKNAILVKCIAYNIFDINRINFRFNYV